MALEPAPHPGTTIGPLNRTANSAPLHLKTECSVNDRVAPCKHTESENESKDKFDADPSETELTEPKDALPIHLLVEKSITNNTLPKTNKGENTVTAGENGVGKIIVTKSSRGSHHFINGDTSTNGKSSRDPLSESHPDPPLVAP